MLNRKIFMRSIYEHLDMKTILAIAGILGPIIFIVADLVSGLLNPGYSFKQSSISSIARSEFGWIQTIGFMAIGILIELFVAGLYFSLKGVRGFKLGLLAMMLFGFGLLLVGAFHTDPPGGPTTFEGTIHGVGAKLVFWSFAIAVLLIAPSLRKDPYWKPLFGFSIGVAVLATIFMAASFALPEDFAWFGLFERILAADEMVWIIVASVWLLRQSRMQRKKVEKSTLSRLFWRLRS